MEMSSLICEKRDYVTYITLNRPERRNALSEEMMTELVSAMRQAGADSEVRVIVLKGAGEKAFCAGGDLEKMRQNADNGIMAIRQFTSKYAETISTFAEVGKPVIAAVHGYALAGGCGIAAASDLTIVAENAVFGFPEINVGWWPGIVTAPLIRLIGMKRAMELFYTGRHIDAQEALGIGLVNRVVPTAELDQEVEKLAQTIASRNPVAIKLGRESLYTVQDMEYFNSIKYLREIVTILANSHDTVEGISSFLEKRKPEWKGY